MHRTRRLVCNLVHNISFIYISSVYQILASVWADLEYSSYYTLVSNHIRVAEQNLQPLVVQLSLSSVHPPSKPGRVFLIFSMLHSIGGWVTTHPFCIVASLFEANFSWLSLVV
jgi:hypothetical protein